MVSYNSFTCFSCVLTEKFKNVCGVTHGGSSRGSCLPAKLLYFHRWKARSLSPDRLALRCCLLSFACVTAPHGVTLSLQGSGVLWDAVHGRYCKFHWVSGINKMFTTFWLLLFYAKVFFLIFTGHRLLARLTSLCHYNLCVPVCTSYQTVLRTKDSDSNTTQRDCWEFLNSHVCVDFQSRQWVTSEAQVLNKGKVSSLSPYSSSSPLLCGIERIKHWLIEGAAH